MRTTCCIKASQPAGLPRVPLVLFTLLLVTQCLTLARPAHADVQVAGDDGVAIQLTQPAQRLVSLAPHLTELVFLLGAGERLLATSSYSDVPAAALTIPRIGSAAQLDVESMVALQPDLVLAWQSGNGAGQIERLRRLGLVVFVLEISRLDQMPDALLRLGQLTGTQAQAMQQAADYQVQLAALTSHWRHAPELRVFYQIWDAPLMTIGREQIVTDLLSRCGLKSIFHDQPTQALTVELESVLARKPDVRIQVGREAAPDAAAKALWPLLDEMPTLHIAAGVLARPVPRMLADAAHVCSQVRQLMVRN